MWILCLFGLLVCVWAAFFGGAQKLEGTFLGYFEFGEFAEKASFIRVAAIIGVALFAFGVIYDLAR